jgi:hypothetical protein
VNGRIVDKDKEHWNAGPGPAVLSKGCRFVRKGLSEFAEIVRADESEVVLILSMAGSAATYRRAIMCHSYAFAYLWLLSAQPSHSGLL